MCLSPWCCFFFFCTNHIVTSLLFANKLLLSINYLMLCYKHPKTWMETTGILLLKL